MKQYLLPKNVAIISLAILACTAFCHFAGLNIAERVGNSIPLFCPFKALTGIPCPGCGMTRALLALTQADFKGAFSYNPFVYFLLIIVMASSLSPVRNVKFSHAAKRRINRVFLCILFILVSYWFFQRLIPSLT